jgi:hypothetical protein
MYVPNLILETFETFVGEWSQRYVDPREELYTLYIGRDLTPERIRALFVWKNGGPLSALKQTSVEKNYIARSSELAGFGETTTPGDFLQKFAHGGAIWRIFWLHCWKPERFPIYDQHVHRAMEYITAKRRGKIPTGDRMVVISYINRYLPFWAKLPVMPDRKVDKALWAFGKALKRLPGNPTSVAFLPDASIDLQPQSARETVPTEKPGSLTVVEVMELVGRRLQNEHGDRPIPTAELVEQVVRECGCSRGSVLSKDHCYNWINKGIPTDNTPMFVQDSRGSYRFLGRNYPYTGPVMHWPKSQQPRQVGEWVRGKLTWF